MTNDECQASLRILYAVAAADGQVHQREADALAVLAKSAFGQEVGEVSFSVDVDRECARISSERAKRLTLSAALVIADVDEQRAPEETAMLHHIYKALGFTGDPDGGLVASVHRARMGILTLKLNEAQNEFLRGLAALSKGGPPDAKAYERLLDELDAKKSALLTGAI